jgi:hypothetical protein
MWRRHTISTLIFQRSVCYCCSNKTGWEQFIWFSTSSYSCCCSSYQKTFYPIFLFFFLVRNEIEAYVFFHTNTLQWLQHDIQWIYNGLLIHFWI